MTELTELSLAEVGDLIRARGASSVEVVKACLKRIAAWQDYTNAFIDLRAEEALREARARDRDLARGVVRGPLHGVPLAHKDMYYRAGRVSTCGSVIRKGWKAPVTCTALARLDAAGAIDLGTLNMAEWAGGPTGHNMHVGDCRNPWNPAHITGGSSSGTGAATAARMVYGGLGSDTGGSIRLPAAACGVVGLKPTWSRVSRYGVMARAWSLDCVGPLARTVRDCARFMTALAGHDPLDPTSAQEPVPDYEALLGGGVKGLRIGLPRNFYFDNAHPEVVAAIKAAMREFEAMGAIVVPITVPDPARMFEAADVLSKTETAVIHRRWMIERPQDYSRQLFARAEAGFHVPAVRYIEAQAMRGPIIREFVERVFSKVDVVAATVIDHPVPTRAETDVQVSGQVPAMVGRITRPTRPFNYLALPAIAVPCGFGSAGLPIAFQLAARPFAEARLMQIAHAYQEATNWHRQTPTMQHN